MNIKLATHKDINKLLKLKPNKNFRENFTLFIPDLMEREITFIAIENNEILGAFAYSNDFPIGKIQIEGKQYIHNKNVNFLQFVEVKPTARKRGIAKQLLTHAFEICAATNSSILLSNIVLEGSHLISTYRELSNNLQVDLFFSPENRKEHAHQVFNLTPIKKENPSFFKRIFKF